MWSICNAFIRYTTTLHHKALRCTRPLREQTRSACRLPGTVQKVSFTLLSEPVQSRRSPQPAPLEALCAAMWAEFEAIWCSCSVSYCCSDNSHNIVNVLSNDTACVFVSAKTIQKRPSFVQHIFISIQFSLQAKQRLNSGGKKSEYLTTINAKDNFIIRDK